MTKTRTATDDAEMRELLRRLHQERPADFKRVVRRVKQALSRELVKESLAASEAAARP